MQHLDANHHNMLHLFVELQEQLPPGAGCRPDTCVIHNAG